MLEKSFGCSSITWETEDGKILLGRTYDQFGNLDDNKIAVIPVDYEMRLEIRPDSSSYMKTSYGFVGMAVLGLETPIMVDGINEAGLMGALLNFPGYADYSVQDERGKFPVHPGFLVTYLLGVCRSVEEVVEKVSGIYLTEELIFGHTMSVHYIFSDGSGESVIIEPDQNGLTIHRNSIGVLANSPDYSWHLTNLCNYTEVTNLPKPPRQIDGMEISVFGEKQGGGIGLPGDYTSPSRFVRMAFMKHYGVKGMNEVDGVSRLFHLFATVDIPEGIVKAGDEENYELTLCTSVMCAQSRTYYFSTAQNQRISAVCLNHRKKCQDICYYELSARQDIRFLDENQ